MTFLTGFTLDEGHEKRVPSFLKEMISEYQSKEIYWFIRYERDMIRPLKPSEFDQAIAFANETFFPNRENDFLLIQPKVYRYPEQFSSYHFVDEVDGKIVGMVACYPIEFQGLKVLGIGTVCVDENYRNQGIMQEMFAYIDQELSNDYDLMYLSGDKKRYEHFSFYKTGQKITFRIKKRNFDKKEYPSFTLTPYQNSDSLIDHELYTIYQAKGKIERDPNRFFDTLRTSAKEIILIKDTDLIGYIVYDKENKIIREIVSKNESIIDVIFNMIRFSGLSEVFYEVSINDENLSLLYQFSETYQISTLANLRIIDYVKTIETLLKQKKNLKKGSLTIKIIDKIKLSIEVDQGISVSEITDQSDFDLVLTEKEAHILFFEHPYFIQKIDHKTDFIQNFFPLSLPCSIMSVDCI